jgi:hypothetical protein
MPLNPKPSLELRHLPVFQVHYTKLEAFIKKVFGFDYDFLFAAGVTEGMGVEYRVTGKLPGDAWVRKAEELRRGRRSKEIILILAVLAHDGFIPAGQYLIITRKLPVPIDVYTDLINQTKNPQAPECLAFKAKHKGDVVFQKRASILDTFMMESNQT